MEKDRKSESDKHAGKLSMPPDVPPLGIEELYRWSLYRALLAEFTATLLFVYIIVATVIGYKQTIATDSDHCAGVGVLGIAWAVGGAIFVLVYSFAGISGGHINPAVTLGLVMARRVSLIRAILYILAQCAGAICGAGVGRAIYGRDFVRLGGAANVVAPGFTLSQGFVTEMIATLFLVLTVLVASDSNGPKRGAHIPILAPLPIGFAVFVAHLLAIPVTGTGINPARSLGSAVILNDHNVWNDQWIFWVGPFVGAVLAAIVYLVIFEADLEVRRWKDTTSNADYHSEKNPLYL